MDPLAQLKDIHLPEQVNNYPLAPGWWILVFALIALFIFSLRKYLAYRLLRKSKRQAIKQLKQNNTDSARTLTILKWAAMQYFPRSQVAKLYGAQFQQFLAQALPLKHQQEFDRLCGETFAQIYQKAFSEQHLVSFNQAALLWLTRALPAKTRPAQTQAQAGEILPDRSTQSSPLDAEPDNEASPQADFKQQANATETSKTGKQGATA